MIPTADMYVFEERLCRPRFLSAVPIIITASTLEAMLITLLSSRSENINDRKKLNKVYTVKNSAVANYFNLRIGRERVSGQHIISSIIDKNDTLTDFDKIKLNNHLVEMYMESAGVLKEQLCNAFILGLFVLRTISV